MIIQHLAIQNLGSLTRYEVDFSSKLNFIDSRHTDQIAATLAFLLCRRQTLPACWFRENTSITAKIRLADTLYTVSATPRLDQLQLLALDPTGEDVTVRYQYLLSHCQEQDEIESFDGKNRSLPYRLCRYFDWENHQKFSAKTERLADTKTFRKHLRQYISDFQPEPICCEKSYRMTMTPRGKFQIYHPNIPYKINLSTTEQTLFRYLCFLNIAEFWADFQGLRDLHHIKKPLLMVNFIEFLDESTNIENLIERTLKLQRQIIILADPMSQELKQKWLGE